MKHEASDINDLVISSFSKLAPLWPLENLIAVNPLCGVEDRPIEDAIKLASSYFEQSDLPREMKLVNIETIKWLQVYSDEGQASITMPLREYGFYAAWRELAHYDEKLHKNIEKDIAFLRNLSKVPEQAIAECLLCLGIATEDQETFLTLLLTTLPGWASYIKCRTEWATTTERGSYKITQVDYLAIRLIITKLLWPEGKQLLHWHKEAIEKTQSDLLEKMQTAEQTYRISLLEKLVTQRPRKPQISQAQIIFCLDVRSEPFRKSLESTGDYQTFGFAGFFGIPVQITNMITGHSYSSCPALLQPKHNVVEAPATVTEAFRDQQGYENMTALKRLYQSLKGNFFTPFALTETLGGLSGIWMGLKTLSPTLASKFKAWLIHRIRLPQALEPSLDSISFEQQCAYAESALRMMGLTHHFAPIVVFCGHGSSTENNAYASTLDCGACGARSGESNAKILALIMNRAEVKTKLAKNGIIIPETTRFIAAKHNTTTDEVILYCKDETEELQKLKQNFEKARHITSTTRLKKLGLTNASAYAAKRRSQDWAQVRPEWGLARNAAFIIASRDMTSSLDLEGRCFLYSYDYTQDPQGLLLTKILTGPVVIAKGINMLYLFSSLNNVSYGSGSKVTHNITGKIGIMQGNGSDLMTGLPLQSLYSSDTVPYHEAQRLMVVVHAPQIILDQIIQGQPILKKLFGYGWLQLAIIDPDNQKSYLLDRNFSWQKVA